MKDELFNELLESVHEGGKILRGRKDSETPPQPETYYRVLLAKLSAENLRLFNAYRILFETNDRHTKQLEDSYEINKTVLNDLHYWFQEYTKLWRAELKLNTRIAYLEAELQPQHPCKLETDEADEDEIEYQLDHMECGDEGAVSTWSKAHRIARTNRDKEVEENKRMTEELATNAGWLGNYEGGNWCICRKTANSDGTISQYIDPNCSVHGNNDFRGNV